MGTRVKLDLATEAGRQEVLQQQGSQRFTQAILTACKHWLAKMATPTLARLKGHRNWERKSLFPSVGAASRKAHKHSHVDPKTEQLLCQLTWASIDFAQHCIAAPGKPEL